MDRIRLLTTLIDHFDSAELATLCFRVGIAADMVAGQTRQDKARELVAWAERNGLVEALVQTIVEMKGDAPRVRESLFGPEGEEAQKPAPYLGLRTFGEAEARYFFGRAALVTELVRRVGAAPFLAVLGPSGSGKSSAVLAGLLPALRNGALPGSDGWRYATLKPGARPLDALAATLATVQGGDVERARRLRPMLASDEQALLTVADLLRAGRADARLVLVVDQFEELWTQAPTEPTQQRTFAETERLPFLRLLLAGTTGLSDEARARSPLVVILTLRADFLHRAAEVPELAHAIQEHIALVSPMSREELREAIEEPARLAGVTVEPGLVPEMLDAVAEEPGALPLLQYTLLELWKLRQSGTLTRTAYDALGGVAGALAARADALLAQHYAGAKRADLRHLLLRLVQPGEGAADTRRRALLREVVPDGSIPAEVQTLLQPLVEERLLTTGRDAATGQETIDLSHESLIRAWPTLRAWIDEGRDDLRLHRQLEGDAREWQRHQEATDLLWGALRVASAEAWQQHARPALSAAERRFLDASRAHVDATRREREALLEARAQAEQQARREAERRAEAEQRARREAERSVSAGRRALTLLVALLLITGLLGGFSWNTANREAEARVVAQNAADEAEAARADAEAEAQRSQALAFAGEALFEVTQAEGNRAVTLAMAASQGVTDTYPLLVSRALRESLQSSPRRILRADFGVIFAAAWSPNANQVATGGQNRTVQIWDAKTGQLVRTLKGHEGVVIAVAWSPDGTQLLTGSEDGTARIWAAGSEQPPIHTLEGHSEQINAVAWSPDGEQVLTGGDDGTARLWDADSEQSLYILEGHSGSVSAVGWKPDGTKVLTGGADGTVRLWEAESGQRLDYLEDESGVSGAAWSPDGEQVLIGSSDGTALLWDIGNESGRQLLGHDGLIRAVAWSPDGQRVITGSLDETARIWDRTSGRLVRTILDGHGGGVLAVGWSPDGEQLLTGGADGVVKLWALGSEQPVRALEGHRESVFAVDWSSDGKRVLTGSEDGTVRLWAVGSRELIAMLEGHQGEIWGAAWSPDGEQVLTGGQDGTARLWLASSGKLRHTLRSSSRGVQSVGWSPDGSQVLTGGLDGTVELWSVNTGRRIRTLEGHSQIVNAVRWSPDGEQVLTGSQDGMVNLWDIKSGQIIRTLDGHRVRVLSAEWSPDGKLILTGSGDGTGRLWESESGHLLRLLEGHSGRVWTVGWSPDGQRVLTGSSDSTVRLWDTSSGQLLHILEEPAGIIWSAAWSPDGKQILTGSEDGTARLWIASDRLVAAALIRRTCTNFTDEQIRATVPTWQGNCADLLEEAKVDADEYERILGLRE